MDQAIIDEVGAGVSQEKGQLEADNAALEEDKLKVDQLQKAPGGDESKLELQAILDEAIASAEVQITVQEAINSIETEDLAKASDDLKVASTQLYDQIRANQLSIKAIE